MANFVFYNPTRVVFGKGTIKDIGKLMKENGAKKALLVAGSGSIKNNGVYNTVVKSLKDSGVLWVEAWGVRANPVLSKAKEMIDLARKEGVDSVLAVGGGSVIDTAKSVAAGFYLDDIWEAYEHKAGIEKALPVYTVLTISAAGSEMDQFAVLTNEEKKRKWNIASDAIYPKVSIVDPSVQATLPWDQTVNGALDALAHIMEFYFVGKNEETVMAIDEALMRTIIRSVDVLKKDPESYDPRADLAWAATLALNGTSGAGLRGGDWSSHWIEHALSALYPDVAHGAGLGVIFPAWIEYVKEENPATFKRWAKNVWGAKDASSAVKKMRERIKKWGNPVSLREFGVKKEDLGAIADKAIEVGKLGALKELGRAEVLAILKKAY